MGRPKSRLKNQFSIFDHLKGFVASNPSAGKTGRNLRLNSNRTIQAVFQPAVLMAVFQIMVLFCWECMNGKCYKKFMVWDGGKESRELQQLD